MNFSLDTSSEPWTLREIDGLTGDYIYIKVEKDKILAARLLCDLHIKGQLDYSDIDIQQDLAYVYFIKHFLQESFPVIYNNIEHVMKKISEHVILIPKKEYCFKYCEEIRCANTVEKHEICLEMIKKWHSSFSQAAPYQGMTAETLFLLFLTIDSCPNLLWYYRIMQLKSEPVEPAN